MPPFLWGTSSESYPQRRCTRFLLAFNTSTSPAFMTQLVCRGCGEGVEGAGLIEAAGCWGGLGGREGALYFVSAEETTAREGGNCSAERK